MQIVVCLKQVPDSSNIRWTKENNLFREGMISILNPTDEVALNFALDIKKRFKNASICAISMGPKQAKSVLEYALAKGADRAILLCDKRFQGSDTLATGTILAHAIKNLVPDFDLILCGQFATDGDTAQTGATIAGVLNIPLEGYVEKITNADINVSIVNKKLEDGIAFKSVKNPSVICAIGKVENKTPFFVKDYVRAQDIGVEIKTLEDIDLSADRAGISGSPTYVSNIFRQQAKRQAKEVEKEAADFILGLVEGEASNE